VYVATTLPLPPRITQRKCKLFRVGGKSYQISIQTQSYTHITTHIPNSFLIHITQAQAHTAAAQHRHTYTIQTHALIACRKIQSTYIRTQYIYIFPNVPLYNYKAYHIPIYSSLYALLVHYSHSYKTFFKIFSIIFLPHNQ